MLTTRKFATTAWALLAATGLAATGLVPAVAPAPGANGGADPLQGLYAVPAIHALPMAAAAPSVPPTAAQCEEYYAVTCYSPNQIEAAYGTDQLATTGVSGTGQTIVVVEPLGSPTIQSDLATFDQAFGLPSPPSFQVITPVGAPPAYDNTSTADKAWAEETSLDVEWAHAMAPGASILLVETPVAETEGVAGFPQILAAENYVIDNHLGDIISQSFESTEETFPSPAFIRFLSATYRNAYSHGITVVSASGDNGVAGYSNPETTTFYPRRVVQWPASDPLVTAVGGTTVQLDAAGNRLAADVAWNDTNNATVLSDFANSAPPQPFASGGGVSSVFERPFYQRPDAWVTGEHRGVPDVAMNAGCTGPVDIYSGAVGGWFITCGTSEAAPLFAGIVALADQVAGHSLGLVNPALYRLGSERAPGIVPIGSGNNTVSFPLTETAGTLTGNSGTLTDDSGTLSGNSDTLMGDATSLTLSSAGAGLGTGPFQTSGAPGPGMWTGNAVTVTGNAVTIQGYSANGAYNLVTGLGTINAAQLVPELARTAGCPRDHRPQWSPSEVWSLVSQLFEQKPWGNPACGPDQPPGHGGQPPGHGEGEGGFHRRGHGGQPPGSRRAGPGGGDTRNSRGRPALSPPIRSALRLRRGRENRLRA